MPTPIRIQPRDYDTLYSLGVARFLTVQALEWLHYPTWRKNWTAFQGAQRQGTATRSYYPQPNLYRRLEGLAGGKLVASIRRVQERATLTFNRLADVYALTEAGAELLAVERGIDPDALSVEGTRPRSLTNLEHSVSIALVYAALRAELEYFFAEKSQRLELVGWQGDHILARGYDRLQDTRVRRGDRMVQVKPPVLPDATFELVYGDRCRRYFVELDRATRPLDSWREKAEAYTAYRQSTQLHDRYGVKDFTLLVVAPSAARLERIAEQIVKIDREPAAKYRFLLTSHIHPTTIRARWQQVTQVTMHDRTIAGKSVQYPKVTFGASPLW